MKVDCEGIFEFINVSQFSEIPDFFYTNCIAILFPYLRSYISTVTVQSNIKPIILPTLNLTPLAKKLRESSKEI
ncbi:MAG: protein-export chaperone SecB [Sphingobacterium sp.]